MCYITTAVCGSLDKPDDCNELVTMRQFRDKWLHIQMFGKTDIDEYYRNAPHICTVIDQSENPKKIYKMIYETYVLPCVILFNGGDSLGCYKMYKAMVSYLQNKYLDNNPHYEQCADIGV